MSLSARDVEILCAMCKSLKSKPEVWVYTRHQSRPTIRSLTSFRQTDMDKFATLAGFSTPASAYTNLRKVLKKVMEDGAVSSPEAKKKGGGRKRKIGM